MPFYDGLSAFLFLILPFAFYRLERVPWRKTLSALGLRPKQKPAETLRLALTCFLVLLAALGILELVLNYFHVPSDPNRIASLSLPLIILAVTIGPLGEEVFFRGFLQPRLGVVLTSLAFGGLHFAFVSPADGAAAFFAALILGYYYRKNKNLPAVALAHALYNAVAIAWTLGLGPR